MNKKEQCIYCLSDDENTYTQTYNSIEIFQTTSVELEHELLKFKLIIQRRNETFGDRGMCNLRWKKMEVVAVAHL